MRKKLFLGLFLMTATIFTGYSQTTEEYTVKPSDGGTTYIEVGDTVIYDEEDIVGLLEIGGVSLGLLVNIECTSAPASEDPNDYTQQRAVTLPLLNAILGGGNVLGLIGFDETEFNGAVGDYEFTMSRFEISTNLANLGAIINLTELADFTINVGAEGTLSLKNVENTPEFSVFSKDGIVTVNNTNGSEVTGMAVYSISGAEVFTSNTAVESIDLSAVANGVYILKVEEGASVTTKKFIKS